jgi:hypothetical protein
VLSTGFHFAQTGRGRKGQQGGGKEEVRKVESLQNHVGENTSALSCTFLRKFVPKVVVPIFKNFLRQKKLTIFTPLDLWRRHHPDTI